VKRTWVFDGKYKERLPRRVELEVQYRTAVVRPRSPDTSYTFGYRSFTAYVAAEITKYRPEGKRAVVRRSG